MYIGNFEITKEMISIALMILFTMAAMFFMGYKFAYNKAIQYANEQIEERIDEFKMRYGIQETNIDYLIGNIEIPVGVENEG